jgi:hypothetical protein
MVKELVIVSNIENVSNWKPLENIHKKRYPLPKKEPLRSPSSSLSDLGEIPTSPVEDRWASDGEVSLQKEDSILLTLSHDYQIDLSLRK